MQPLSNRERGTEVFQEYITAESDEQVRMHLAFIASRRELVVDDVRVSYRVWEGSCPAGTSRPTIVLIHGNAARTEWWDAIAPGLTSVGDVIAVDLARHGESQWKQTYDFADWSREVVAVLEREGSSGDVILVGHSLGGLVSLTMAWEHPSLVSGVILLDTPFRRFTAEQLEKRVAIATRPLPRYETLDQAVDWFKTTPALVRRQDDVWDRVARSSHRRETDGWVLHFDPRLLARVTDVDRFIRRFPSQTYLVRAEHGLITEQVLEEMLPCLPGKEHLITIPGAGHNLLLEFPCAITELVPTIVGRM